MSTYINAADEANRALATSKLAYESTTRPLNSINDNLSLINDNIKDLKVILSEILVLLKKRV